MNYGFSNNYNSSNHTTSRNTRDSFNSHPNSYYSNSKNSSKNYNTAHNMAGTYNSTNGKHNNNDSTNNLINASNQPGGVGFMNSSNLHQNYANHLASIQRGVIQGQQIPSAGGPAAVAAAAAAAAASASNDRSASQLPQPALMASNSILTLGPYKHRKDLTRESVLSKYSIIGYIAAGTYGKVYKAKSKIDTSGGNTRGLTQEGAINVDNDDDDDDVALAKRGKKQPTAQQSANQSPPAPQFTEEDVQDMMKSKINELSGKTAGAVNSNNNQPTLFAIKKFKSDNNSSKSMHPANEVIHYTGISQSAIREMSICRELNHQNITKLIDIILENKSIYMIFEFFEHDLLQIIHFHSHPEIKPIPESTIKSLIWQVLNGVTFLHKNWIFHRDLKPANIMVSSSGVVKIGDLGLARKFNNPLQSLYTGDKVVVTIWYRAPELLLGTRHYTPAIDLWAVGCILAELLSLRPIFKGEEAKLDLSNKKSIPFQKNQLQKIIEILGTPNTNTWPALTKYPEYLSFQQIFLSANSTIYPNNLANWYKVVGGKNKQCLSLLKALLEYDPLTRATADDALLHPYFLELPKVNTNAFDGLAIKYPSRRIYTDDNDILASGKAIPQVSGGGRGGQQGNAQAGANQMGQSSMKRNGYDDMGNRKRQR